MSSAKKGKRSHSQKIIILHLKQKWFILKLKKEENVLFRFCVIICSDFNQKIIGVSFSYEKNQAVYFPSSEETVDLIQKILLNNNIKKIGFDIKSQIKILKKYNITEVENFFDISIAHYLLQPDMRHDIDLLAENYLGQSSMDINSMY